MKGVTTPTTTGRGGGGRTSEGGGFGMRGQCVNGMRGEWQTPRICKSQRGGTLEALRLL